LIFLIEFFQNPEETVINEKNWSPPARESVLKNIYSSVDKQLEEIAELEKFKDVFFIY
jgi:hypothetical protein